MARTSATGTSKKTDRDRLLAIRLADPDVDGSSRVNTSDVM